MSSIPENDQTGKSFTIHVPQTNDPKSPCWLVWVNIEVHTTTEIRVFFCCQDWLSADFTLPTPKHLTTLFESIYMSVCEMIAEERIEFLCSL